MIPTPDWNAPSTLIEGDVERQGALHELILYATRLEIYDRPPYLIISKALGELDNEQIEDLRRRLDFPDLS